MLSQRETRRGVEILEEDRYHQISDEFDWVVAPVQFGDKFLNVRGEYEGVKNVIDTVRGSKESIQGQVGLTYEADGETRPNEFLQNHLILTLAGHYDAPQHLNLQGEFGLDGDIPAEGEFHAAIFEDGEFEEMVVDPDENGGYETHHRIEGASPSFIGERYRGT